MCWQVVLKKTTKLLSSSDGGEDSQHFLDMPIVGVLFKMFVSLNVGKNGYLNCCNSNLIPSEIEYFVVGLLAARILSLNYLCVLLYHVYFLVFHFFFSCLQTPESNRVLAVYSRGCRKCRGGRRLRVLETPQVVRFFTGIR